MILRGESCLLRPYALGDASWLLDLAGDYDVVRWMAASFPHPYTETDALDWVARASEERPCENFVIEFAGEPAGGIGMRPQGGESRGVAEFGYWLGRRFWGRGLATAAIRLFVPYAFEERGMRRLEALVFSHNVASARVLEKCGFEREGVLREAVTDRDGIVMDSWQYGRLRG